MTTAKLYFSTILAMRIYFRLLIYGFIDIFLREEEVTS